MNIPLFLILALGGLIRIIGLKNPSFWNDEAFFAIISQNLGWTEMIAKIGTDIHPPVYFILLKTWGFAFGNSELALRSLSVVFGILSIYLVYLIASEVFLNHADEIKKISLLAALLVAINPFLIQSTMQATSFSMASSLILSATYFFIRALRENRQTLWIIYSFVIAAAVYTHYLVLFAFFVHLIYLAYHLISKKDASLNSTQRYLFPLGSILLAVLIFLPWSSTFWRQITNVQQGFWVPSIDTPLIILVFSILAVIALFFFFSRTINETNKWLLILLSLVPYIIFSVPFLTIITAVILIHIRWSRVRKIAIVTFLFLNLGVLIFQTTSQDTHKNPGMRGASQFIDERASDSDKMLLGSKFIDYSFRYYNKSAIQPNLILGEELFEHVQTKSNDNIWLVWTTGFDEKKPNVPGNWKIVEETPFTDTPKFKGDVIVTQYLVE
jgi:mannosyltransferase